MALSPKDMNRDGAADKRLEAAEKYIDDRILHAAPGGVIEIERHRAWALDLAGELRRRYEAVGWRVDENGTTLVFLWPPKEPKKTPP